MMRTQLGETCTQQVSIALSVTWQSKRCSARCPPRRFSLLIPRSSQVFEQTGAPSAVADVTGTDALHSQGLLQRRPSGGATGRGGTSLGIATNAAAAAGSGASGGGSLASLTKTAAAALSGAAVGLALSGLAVDALDTTLVAAAVAAGAVLLQDGGVSRDLRNRGAGAPVIAAAVFASALADSLTVGIDKAARWGVGGGGGKAGVAATAWGGEGRAAVEAGGRVLRLSRAAGVGCMLAVQTDLASGSRYRMSGSAAAAAPRNLLQTYLPPGAGRSMAVRLGGPPLTSPSQQPRDPVSPVAVAAAAIAGAVVTGVVVDAEQALLAGVLLATGVGAVARQARVRHHAVRRTTLDAPQPRAALPAAAATADAAATTADAAAADQTVDAANTANAFYVADAAADAASAGAGPVDDDTAASNAAGDADVADAANAADAAVIATADTAGTADIAAADADVIDVAANATDAAAAAAAVAAVDAHAVAAAVAAVTSPGPDAAHKPAADDRTARSAANAGSAAKDPPTLLGGGATVHARPALQTSASPSSSSSAAAGPAELAEAAGGAAGMAAPAAKDGRKGPSMKRVRRMSPAPRPPTPAGLRQRLLQPPQHQHHQQEQAPQQPRRRALAEMPALVAAAAGAAAAAAAASSSSSSTTGASGWELPRMRSPSLPEGVLSVTTTTRRVGNRVFTSEITRTMVGTGASARVVTNINSTQQDVAPGDGGGGGDGSDGDDVESDSGLAGSIDPSAFSAVLSKRSGRGSKGPGALLRLMTVASGVALLCALAACAALLMVGYAPGSGPVVAAKTAVLVGLAATLVLSMLIIK